MSDIALHTDGGSFVTCVSNTFIDHYMTDANGEYVKIYLYLLRCLGNPDVDFSISAIAQKLGHTDLDVKRALQYWEARNLLRLEYDWNQQLVGICLVDGSLNTLQMQSHPQTTVMPSAATFQVRVPASAQSKAQKQYTPAEVVSFGNNKEIKDLMMLAQCYSQKQLTQNDMNTIIFWYDGLSMSPALIEFLINHCASNGHTSLSYMNKIALSWADQGISTLEEAEADVLIHSDAYRAVVSNLGQVNRGLNPTELQFLNTWVHSFGFSPELIGEACSRATLRGTSSPVKYANRILEGWHKDHVKTMDDVAALDQQYANSIAVKKTVSLSKGAAAKVHNFDERTDTDWDALELKLLQKK